MRLFPLVALLLALALPGAAHARPKVALLRLNAIGVDGALAMNLDEQLAHEVNATGCCELVTPSDLAALLGFEATKQRLGCEDDASSCAAELAGALGVSHVLSGSVGKVGDTWTLSLSLIAVGNVRAVSRSAQQVKGPAEALLEALERATHELLQPFVPERPLAGKVLVGTGAALLAGALGTGLAWHFRTTAADFRQAEIPAADRLAITTDVLLGLGVASLVSGVVVLLAADGGRTHE